MLTNTWAFLWGPAIQSGKFDAIGRLSMRDLNIGRENAMAEHPISMTTGPWVSGLYTSDEHPEASIRLDVDHRYPQTVASGTISSGVAAQAHWIANLVPNGIDEWTGSIWFRHGNTLLLPFSEVRIRATRSVFPDQRFLDVTFGAGPAAENRRFRFASPFFRTVEFEFDSVEGTEAVTEIQTFGHPNRPLSLVDEPLSIAEVYRRAGFEVRDSGGAGQIPLSASNTDALWSDMEMHDAMQDFWSRFAHTPQWFLWVLFAGKHEPVPEIGITPDNLGGIMFDDIGPNHRQGTAIFNESFISRAPSHDTVREAFIARTKFWTACHEMGHAFNLAHSWQKSMGVGWIPLQDNNEARSFMSYPDRVDGGQAAFYSNFEYRFSDDELLFMRHAPERFVQMGNADWFDDHGFRQAAALDTDFQLIVRVNRDKPVFSFLEPVVVELKLKNIAGVPRAVPADLLTGGHDLTVIIKRHGHAARTWRPYAQHCRDAGDDVIPAGESHYRSLLVSAGLTGYEIADPGTYDIQVALHLGNRDLISNVCRIRVAAPGSYDHEKLAQDFFCEEVGRILFFRGSVALESGNNALREAAARFPEEPVALHASFCLANPKRRAYKRFDTTGRSAAVAGAPNARGRFVVQKARPEEALKELQNTLIKNANQAAQTIGHVAYKGRVDQLCDWLVHEGDVDSAARFQIEMRKTLAVRHVKKEVLKQIDERARMLSGITGSKAIPKKGITHEGSEPKGRNALGPRATEKRK